MDFSMPGQVGKAAVVSNSTQQQISDGDGDGNTKNHNIYEKQQILQQKLIECGFYDYYVSGVTPFQFIDIGWGGRETDQIGMFGNTLDLGKCVPRGKPNVWWRINPHDRLHFCVVAFDPDYIPERKNDEPSPSSDSHVSTDEQEGAATGDQNDNGDTNNISGGNPYLLWLRVNVTDDMTVLSSGRDVARWQPPHPAAGRTQRLFIAVFIQGVGEVPDVAAFRPLIPTNSRRHRHNFDLKQLARDLKLKLVGCNCVRFTHDAAVHAKVTKSLRDEIILDPKGRKVIAEIENGVRKDL